MLSTLPDVWSVVVVIVVVLVVVGGGATRTKHCSYNLSFFVKYYSFLKLSLA